MNDFIKKHLDKVTVDGLVEFRTNAFASWASCSGVFSIGVNGIGQFVVKTRTETFAFNNPADAIEKYSDLVSSHHND